MWFRVQQRNGAELGGASAPQLPAHELCRLSPPPCGLRMLPDQPMAVMLMDGTDIANQPRYSFLPEAVLGFKSFSL